MRTLIITYSRTKNYGGILQSYGLYRYLSDAGYETEFIDYYPQRCNVENKKIFTENSVCQSKFWGRNGLTKFIWMYTMYPTIRKRYEPFRRFLDTRAKFTDRYESLDDLKNNIPEGDVYITGSDQVWNSQLNKSKSIDVPFFLGFVNGVKKISYAPSFGGSNLPDNESDEVKKLLSDYSHISVREKGGQKLLNDLDIKADVVADPTILCNPSVWKELVKKQNKNNYVFLYQIKFDKNSYNLAREMAEKSGKNLCIIVLNPNDKHLYKENIKDVIVCPDIEEWLSYISNAELVITDSFHACVFSLIFHTKFIVDINSRKGMSGRIVDLLDKTGFKSRILDNYDLNSALKIYESEYDFEASDKALEEYRIESAKWLENAINN